MFALLLALLFADARFDAIVARTEPREMIAWAAEHPADPLAPRGLLWVAQLERSRGHLREARAAYEQVARAWPATEWALHARKGIADLDVQSFHFGRAIETFESLAREPSPFWQSIGEGSLRAARTQRERFWIFVVALGWLCLLWLFRLRKLRLWPPPRELIYVLPALALMLCIAPLQESDEAIGVVCMALCSLVLVWLNGAFLATRPPRLPLQLGLAIVQLCAALYCCLLATGLWVKLLATFAGGGD